MTVNDVKTQSADVKSDNSATQSADSHLGAQVFSNGQDFLQTLRDHYAELSHGHKGIGVPDLQLEAATNQDEKVRAAAQIAADPQHFKELSDIWGRYEKFNNNTGKYISQIDIEFAQDMNNHSTKKYYLDTAVGDVAHGVGMVVGGAFTAFGGATIMAISDFAADTNVAIGLTGAAAQGTAIGVGAFLGGAAVVAGAVLAVGGMGYYGYEAYKERRTTNALADRDSQMFRSWLNKQ
ncbi:MAG TPA: hypothetical protein V6D22_08680 [Candidatus Obscuribacterales bacterium]